MLLFVGPTAAQSGGASQRSGIAAVWANSGEDKVTRDERRAAVDPRAVLNTRWDGRAIAVAGARNEVVAFNLVLEAGSDGARNVSVTLEALTGPSGAVITSRAAEGEGLFDFRGRNIELFYVRYLEIRGLSSALAYGSYDERHVSARCRRPHDGSGRGRGGWRERPCHNRLYPDIAVPIELASPFEIPAEVSQSVWVDVYIPRTAPAGTYTGVVTVREGDVVTWRVPIRLQVHDFALPEVPSARTMVAISPENLGRLYLGEAYPAAGTANESRLRRLVDRHFQLAHRHRISLVEGYTPPEQMERTWLPRLDGSLFTAAAGYDGPGAGEGNNVYAIGLYGSWPWKDGGKAAMWAQSDAWVRWFDAQRLPTPTDYFLYLIDESSDFPLIEQWAAWLDENPGPGRRLRSLATLGLEHLAEVPSLDIPVVLARIGPAQQQAVADAHRRARGKPLYAYNGARPATGSFAIEDEGVAQRALAWAQYKKGIDRWFYWESTYYLNYQCYGAADPRARTPVFRQAQTFGCACPEGAAETGDACKSFRGDSQGDAGPNYHNGDGVLFYPGTNRWYPEDDYGVPGPFASLRLKHWRRGLQDVDYLTLAAAVDKAATQAIVQRRVPKVMWEYGVSDPSDPTWVRTDISWSVDPDDWEHARRELVRIIERGGRGATGGGVARPAQSTEPTNNTRQE